jgi:hypothetical protein
MTNFAAVISTAGRTIVAARPIDLKSIDDRSVLERLDHRRGKGVAQGLYDEGKTIAKVPGSST